MNKFIKTLIVVFGMCVFTGAMAADAKNISQEVFTKSLPQQLQLSPQESSALYQNLQQIIQLRNLDQPVFNVQYVLNWTTNTVRDLYTFGFQNYEMALRNSHQKFTEESWGFFNEQLKKSGLLKAVESKKLMISSGLFKAPVLQQQGVVNGIYTWKIQVPLLVFYQGPTSSTSHQLLVTVQVIRTQLNNHTNGLLIESIMPIQQK